MRQFNPMEELLKWASYHVRFKDTSDAILNHERFAMWSGSSKQQQHHYGIGGLAKHTMEVVHTSFAINDYYGGVESPALYFAGLYHDSGKMWDYEPVDRE